MSDVAALGLAVDSAPVTAATAALQNFTAAATPAAAAADRVVLANGKLGPAMQSVESMAKRAGVSVDEMTKRIQAQSASFGAANTGMSAFAKQTQAVVVANQNAVKAANDNTQAVTGLSKAAGENDRTFSLLANTLTRRVIYGFIAAQAKDAVAAIVSLNSELAKTGDIAARVKIGSGAFQGIVGAAAGKGVDSGSLADGMLKFNEQLTLAKSGLGTLNALLHANGVAITDSQSAFFAIANLVQRSTDDYAKQVSILQQAGLPATREMVRFMEQGSNAIKAQIAAQTTFSTKQLEDAQRLDDRWNEFWESFKRGGKSAVLEVSDAKNWTAISIDPGSPADIFWQFMTRKAAEFKQAMQGAVPQFLGSTPGDFIGTPNPAGAVTRLGISPASAPVPVVDPEKLKQTIALEQQRISILGQTATIEQQVKAVELGIQTARLNNIKVTNDEAANIKRVAEEQALGTFQIKAQTDAENVKIEALFKSNEAGVAYALVQTRINEERRKGNELSPEAIKNLQKEADEFAKTKKKADEYKETVDALRSAATSFGVDLVRNLRAGESAMTALGHAAQGLSQTLTSGAISSLLKGDFIAAGVQGIGAVVASIFGDNQAKKDAEAAAQAKAVEDAAAKLTRIASLTQRALTAAIDTNTRAGALALQNIQFASELAALPPAARPRILPDGRTIVREDPERVALLNAQGAERLALQKQWDEKELAELKAYNEARLARELSYQDRLFAATNDNTTLEGALAEFDRNANQERIQEMTAGGEQINDLIAAQEAERLNIYKKFADLAQQQAEEAAAQAEQTAKEAAAQAEQTAKETADYIKGVSKNIHDFLQGLKTGSSSILSPKDQLAAAQHFFDSQLGLARGGDKDALSSITQTAQTLLELAKSFYASGSGYANVYNAVTSSLQNLGYQNGGLIPGYAGGGMVGNGMFGVDSVLARFAGGGNIALAGGEFVMPAAQTRANLPRLEAMRSGASNDNAIESLGQQLVRAMAGVSIAEMGAHREDSADLRNLILRLIRAVEGNKPHAPRPGSETKAKAV